MRLIDADALRDALGITGTADSCKGCKYNDRFEFACNTDAAPTFEYVCEMIDDAPTIEERKTDGFTTWEKSVADSYRVKDIIQKFHDYQVEWLKSHYDIELEPLLEEMIVRFLHDTANCYMMEAQS